MKKLLSSLCLSLICSTHLFAYDCIVDGIYYSLNTTEMTAGVTNETGNWKAQNYSGSVVIPSSITYNSKTYSVTEIGYYAFDHCSGLTSIEIPNSVTTIGKDAFSCCSSLTSITIPNSVTTIEDYAFSYCSNLTSVTIPNSVTTIGWGAFEGCFSLTSVTIPNSVTTIGRDIFGDCSSLTSPIYNDNCFVFMPTSYTGVYTIPSSIKQIAGGAFRNCSGLTSLTIPYSVTTIGEWAFFGCSSLISVTIANSVTTIGKGAFVFCFCLTSITIPNSVTTIGEEAFYGCSGFTSITCETSVPPVCGRDCFLNVNKSIPLYVPAGSVDAYKAADEWKDFTNIRSISTAIENIDANVNADVNTHKFLRNGQVIIRQGDKTYNIVGREM